VTPRRSVVIQLGSLVGIGTITGSSLSLSACGGGESTKVNEPLPVSDTTPPAVTAVTPGNGTTNISLNSPVSAMFSESMNAGTLIAANFTVVSTVSGASAPGTVSSSANSITFTPTSNLANNSQYRASLTTGIKDIAGNALANYNWVFTTLPPLAGDTTAPVVFATSPINGAVSVPLTDSVTVTFSESMVSSSLTSTSFRVANMTAGASIAGTVSVAGNSATFAPAVNFASNTQYRATITVSATDLAGNPLAADYTWTFTTLTTVVPDTTPPVVSSTSPADGATAVTPGSPISVIFSEAMTVSSVNTTSFTIAPTAGGAVISGSVNASGNNATFTPAVNLTSNTQYRATITTAARDAAGNALASNHSWVFTTLTVVTDTTPPTVSATTPADGATSIALGATISVTFSEAMTTSSLNASSFTVTPALGGAAVSGSISASGNGATFTPAVNLASNTQYRATITTAARDAAGNALTSNHVWTFTTVLTDTTPPTVASNTPADGATSVTLGTAISVIFSEAMTTSSLNTSSFSVATVAGGTPVSGSVNASGNGATFTPVASLVSNTQYRATISTAARDAAGNALATNYTWVFTTTAGSQAAPALGAHGLSHKPDGSPSMTSLASPSLTTQGAGSTIVACVGRGVISSHVAPTDNKSNAYAQIGSVHAYQPKYPNSGTALYAVASALGGSGHVVTASNTATPSDEITLAVVEVQNGGVVTSVWNEVQDGSALTTLPITTTGPATLIAFWWGDADGSFAHSATPGNGFARVDAVLLAGSLVQCAVATRDVSAAGSYSMTWTSVPSEGAQLWLVAVQNAN
jgi:Bacterial Ig-like domain